MASPEDFLDLSFRELAEQVAARTPAPSGGSVAALVLSLAAGLVAMASRFSEGWEQAGETLAEAEALRARAAQLAGEDAVAYGRLLDARRAARSGGGEQPVEAALAGVVAVPAAIAGCACRVAELGRATAELGNRNLTGDATAGALLAASCARVAARLVAINLAGHADPRLAEAETHADRAETAASAATQVG